MMDYPLQDIKILDFTYLLPGPFGTMMLADLGADIIKIENSTNPDLMRMVPPFVDGISAAYAHINRGKRSLTLNLKKKEARDIVFELVKDYDIIVEQFRPGVMEKLGLGYPQLKAINDKIIYCSLTGYGQTGSYSSRAGHDINYMALSGVESFSGRKGSGPSLSGIQVADIAGGSKNLVIGVLAACIQRLRTGRGDYIDVSITDGVFSMSLFSTAGFLADGEEPSAETGMLNGGTIYDFYRTSDQRYLSVGPIEPKFFQSFCEVTGCEHLLSLAAANENSMRKSKNEVAEVIASKPLNYWIEKFRDCDACVEPVYSLAEAVENPPIAERDMIISITNETGTAFRQTASPIKFSSGNYHATMAGSTPGYHNRDILASLGYSESEIMTLEKNGAIGAT
jgi:alpha-methylacyl-CoA racemase